MGVKWRKVIALLLAFVVVVTTAATGIPLTVKAAETSTGFVKRDGTKFTLDGSDFYYAGTNNYYINFKPSEDVDEVMKDAEDMGLTVIRTWGHLDVGTITDKVDTSDNCPVFEGSVDGKGQKEGVYYQYWDATQNKPVVNHGENGLQKLDYVIYQAEKHNIKILPTLTNYWEPFGGMAQYCVWAGLTKSDVEQFYSNETIKGWFKNYISEVLNHKNVYTGRYLKDEPAILAWELANEPRYNAQNKSIENNAMYQWASEMSAYIKGIDENHMVSVGDEGGMYYNEYVSDHPGSNAVPEGEAVKTGGHIWHGGMGNFHHLMQIKTIDFATPHLYPGVWQMSSQAELESWLKLHAEVAHDANKPVVLEEFGWSNKETAEGVTEYAAGRDNFFKYIYNAMEEYDYAGSNFWMLGSHTLNDACGYYPDYDGFTVYNFEGALSNDGNGQYTVDLYGTNSIIKEHAETMNNKGNKNKVSESTITYDKANPSDCKVTITPQDGASVSSISVDGKTVSEGDVYSLSDNTLTFKQTYLDGLEDSTYYVTITMTEGRNLQLKVVVMDSSITSAVAGDGPFIFDKNVKVAKDVTIPVVVNDGDSCKGVSVLEADNTKTALSSDAYSVTDSGVTISANYLLGMDEGDVTVILDYAKGTDPIVTITIKDTTGKDVIDDFESYESDSALSAAWAVNTSGGTVTPTLVTGQSESNAMKYDFSYSNGYAGITKSAGSLPVTDFDGISFWIKAEETTDNDLTIQLSEPAGDYSSIYWEKTYTWADMKAAGGTTIKIPFSEFAAKSGYTQPADGQVCGDNGVSEFSIYVGGNTQTNSFYIDDIQLYSEGGSDITNVDVESVTLSKDTLTIEEGKSEQLTATVSPDTATFKTVNWASEDTTIATVVNGKVTGVGEGTTTITCTSAVDSSKKATCEVTVTKAAEVTTQTSEVTTQTSATTTGTAASTTQSAVLTGGTLIDDFSKNTVGKETQGYLWYTNPGYQYNNGSGTSGSAEPAISWNSEKECMDIALDYSADSDKSWSEAKIALWKKPGYDISEYNCLSLQYTYPENLKDVAVKVYASNPAQSESEKVVLMDSNMERTNEVDNGDGTYTATMILYFTPTSEETLGSINIGFVGKYSDQAGIISIDDVRVSSQKIAGATEIPEVGTATTVDLDKMPSEVKMADSKVNAKTAAAYAYLMGTVNDGKVLFGHQNDNSRRVAAEVSDTKDMVGSYSAVVAYDSLAITGSELGVSTSEGLAQTVSASKDAIANGAIISLSLHMPNFATMAKEGSTDFSKYDFDSSKDLNNNCAESILPGKANNALYNQYLDIIADYANQLDGEPILFRPLHENSGGWFWWGSSTNVETYKALWRYTVDYLTETKNVHNLIFVYSPNGPITSEAQYLERYPGDEYVDVFGFDYYNDYGQGATYNTSFEEGLNTSCSVINGLAEARGKVAVIAETGVRVTKADGTNEGLLVSGNPINDKDWYNMVNNVAAENGIAYFLLWANFSNQNFYVPYKFDETTGQELSDDFVAFYNNETSVFADGTNYQDAIAKTVTATSYTEPAGYMIAPVDFAEYPTATTFTASVKRAEKVTFEIKRNAEDTEPVVVIAEKNTAGIYEAQITDAVLAEVGEVDVAIVTLKGDDTVIASAKYISLGKEKDKMPAGMVDNFDYYYGDQSYLASQYCGSNSAAGCGSSMSITKSNAKDGTYAGKYTYQLSYAGSEGYTGTGRILSVNDYSKTPDGNDTNALSMWVKPDGNGQKLVVQFVSDGYEFEAYLTEFMKGTEAQYVTIPFSAMKPKVSGKVFNPANVTQMYFYCNTMPDNAPVADKTNFSFESAIYFDKIMAIAADEDKLAEAGTQGYVVSDTMLDGSVDEERPEVSVTGVTLDPSEVTLEAGKTLTLNVSVEPEDATNTDVTWSSSDETVATVINGVVTAVAEGNATITVTTVDGEMTATCEVTVTATSEDDATTEETDATTEETEVTTAGAPSSEDLATTEGTDVTTEETDATTAGAPSSEDMATTEGTSSSEDDATTEGTSSSEDDATTEGTSSSEDDATTEGTSSSEDDATTEGTSSSEDDATTQKNPSSEDNTTTQGNPSTEEPAKVPVDSVELNKESVGMLVGDEITLTETVYPVDATNKAVTWRTGNSSIATVENGVVKAVSEGVTSIIVITEDGSFTAVCSVYVSSAEIPVTGVSFVKDSMVLVEGESEVLKVTIEPKDATNQKVEFESSDYNIANVDANGKVTAIGKGTAIITVTTADGAKQASILVEVQPKGEASIPVQGITATDSNVNMVVGDAKQLTYTITPANATNQTVQWETNDSDVVTVTNGILKAVGTGTAKVRVTTEDGSYVAIWNITVTAAEVAVEGVSVTETMISLEEGDTKKLEYSVLPADATNPKVKFESRDQNIVNIDATGNITAISAGTTTIDIITLDGGYRAVVMIEVTAKDSGSTNQPGGDNTTQQPGGDNTTQQPSGDSTTQQPSEDNTSQQPGGDNTSQQPGEDNTSQQPGEDNTSQQPGGDNTSQQPGEDNTSQQPGGDSTSQQPGGDSTAQQPGGDSTTQQSGGTNATTQQPAGSNSTTAQQPGGANATTAQPAGSTQTDSTAAKKVKKVTGLKKVKAGTKSIKLKWKKLSSVKGYKVYVYNAKTKKYKLYKTVKKTNVTVKKLTRNKTYKFKVRAYTKDGGSTIYGSYSKVLKVKTKK